MRPPRTLACSRHLAVVDCESREGGSQPRSEQDASSSHSALVVPSPFAMPPRRAKQSKLTFTEGEDLSFTTQPQRISPPSPPPFVASSSSSSTRRQPQRHAYVDTKKGAGDNDGMRMVVDEGDSVGEEEEEDEPQLGSEAAPLPLDDEEEDEEEQEGPSTSTSSRRKKRPRPQLSSSSSSSDDQPLSTRQVSPCPPAPFDFLRSALAHPLAFCPTAADQKEDHQQRHRSLPPCSPPQHLQIQVEASTHPHVTRQ